MRHEIKIQDNYFLNIVVGNKKAEIRYNDRDYQLGDLLDYLTEDGSCKRRVSSRITHIHSGLGLKEGYVALSIEPEDS